MTEHRFPVLTLSLPLPRYSTHQRQLEELSVKYANQQQTHEGLISNLN